ncbi:DUF2207 family protein [Salipaludibacillus daqingensis]|uniref:DUF2207 family protein n=1 Tax=Salipaludibacillus daqingensis TaxID=3041001 RepID=UPI0024730FEC|nr:DUF2207 domain-containing protein [Salipaludibacillus daqingensis]
MTGMFSSLEIGFLVIFLVLMITVFSVIGREKWKRKHIVSMASSSRDLTEKDFKSFSPPMIAQLIYGRGAYTRHITAGLLNLVRKRMLTLKEDERGPSYYFSVEGVEEKTTSKSEQYLIDWILFEVGQNGVFYVDDLFVYTEGKHQRDIFIQRLYEWEETMKLELKTKGLLNMFPSYKRVLLMLSVVMILLGSGFIIASPLLSILYLVAGIATFITMLSVSSKTFAGQLEYQKWQPFIEELTTSPEKKDEQWLTASFVYAIAFGLKEDYLSHFPIREASQVSLQDERFPLYFAMAPGATAISLEGKNMVDDLEASLDKVISPIAHSENDIENEFNDFSE